MSFNLKATEKVLTERLNSGQKTPAVSLLLLINLLVWVHCEGQMFRLWWLFQLKAFSHVYNMNMLFSTNCSIKSRWTNWISLEEIMALKKSFMCKFVHTSPYRPEHVCVQPAGDAVLCCRFHAAPQCLAVNISWAENKQSTAEIQRKYVSMKRKQSGFSVLPQLICWEWKQTKKKGMRPIWTGSVRSNQCKHVLREEQKHVHRDKYTNTNCVSLVVPKLLTLYSYTHTHILRVRQPWAKNCWPCLRTNTYARSHTPTHTHNHR